MPPSNSQAQASETPRAPPESQAYDCTTCRYILGKSGRVCGVCVKKILSEQKGHPC